MFFPDQAVLPKPGFGKAHQPFPEPSARYSGANAALSTHSPSALMSCHDAARDDAAVHRTVHENPRGGYDRGHLRRRLRTVCLGRAVQAAVRASDLARTGRAAASPDLAPGRDQPTYMARDIARTVVVDRVSGSTAGVDDAGRVGEPEWRIPFSGGLP